VRTGTQVVASTRRRGAHEGRRRQIEADLIVWAAGVRGAHEAAG
jgi:NADH dehydrogenase FAD-containing subunit